MVYLPRGKNIPINMAFIKNDKVNVWWFNPRNGDVKQIGPKDKVPVMSFTPPTLGLENDWVLVLDDPRYNYGPPGKK